MRLLDTLLDRTVVPGYSRIGYLLRSGRFWHDRRPRPEHYLPWTRETAADRERLWAWCDALTA